MTSVRPSSKPSNHTAHSPSNSLSSRVPLRLCTRVFIYSHLLWPSYSLWVSLHTPTLRPPRQELFCGLSSKCPLFYFRYGRRRTWWRGRRNLKSRTLQTRPFYNRGRKYPRRFNSLSRSRRRFTRGRLTSPLHPKTLRELPGPEPNRNGSLCPVGRRCLKSSFYPGEGGPGFPGKLT